MADGTSPIAPSAPAEAVTPGGINHLVINVRDIEESHRFWTEIVGFRQVGELKPRPDRPNPPKMRFYSGVREDGTSHHHDVALVENRDLPKPPENWSMFGMPCAVNHIAITMPSREAWLEHLAYLQKKGVKFYKTPDSILQRQLTGYDAAAAKKGEGNAMFKEIEASQKKFAERAVKWDLDTNVGRRMAYNHYFGRKAAPAKKS